jgi:glycosyltransferase involved in cell wall biosynthesis
LIRCSIVIRSYNEEAHVARLLVGIMNQTVREVEIILVDSGSTDATRAIASRYPVRILHIDPSSFSFGRSLNMGCAAAQGETVVVASAHIYPVYADWLEQLLRPFDDERVAVVYGKQRGGEETRWSEHRLFRQWFPEMSVPRQESAFCNNANAAIRRSLWLRRPYDEDLPAWRMWSGRRGLVVKVISSHTRRRRRSSMSTTKRPGRSSTATGGRRWR